MIAAALLLASCTKPAAKKSQTETGGDAQRGAAAITRYGCAACHVIPGIAGANGTSGPSLAGIASRTHISGALQNTPENMMKWIQNPQAINPKTLMPNVGVTDQDARDIASYLYTLK